MRLDVRFVAPAGAPIGALDLAAWLAAARRLDDPQADLRRAVASTFGVKHAVTASTGRAGLTLLLRAMRSLADPKRCEVVLPSYTCYSVAASTVKAGLSVRVVDIDPTTLDYNAAALRAVDPSRVLAVVATNLYGLPNDLPRLSQLARDWGVFLVDDAAQAMGAHVGGRYSGTWGDAGLFSFDKGKNVSAIDGGVIVTSSDDLAAALERVTAPLPLPTSQENARHVVKALVYSAFLRPSLYWIPNSIPALGLGATVYTTEFELAQLGGPLAALAVTMLKRCEEFRAERATSFARLHEALSGLPDLTSIAPRSDVEAACLRFPVLAATPELRDRMLVALRSAGIGASESYPGSIADVPELRSHLAARPEAAGGRMVARRILTLPTHRYMTAAFIDRAASVIRRTVETRGRVAAAPVAVN